MKRIIGLLLVLMLMLTVVGCSSETTSQKTEEELKAEIRAEMEAEMKSEQSNDNSNNNNEIAEAQDENDAENQEETMTLKGKFISNDIGGGVLLEDDINVQGENANEIYLSNISVEDYLQRSYFTYQMYVNAVLKDEYNSNIDIEVEVDKNSFNRHEEMGVSVEAKKIISLNGEKNPTYKADQGYPIDFYEDTFFWYLKNISTDGHMFTQDIKDFDFYNEIEDFKVAVDKILESGLFIQMSEGEYMINETEKTYYE